MGLTRANVCDVLVRLLGEIGVKHIFGVPGDAINALTESIRQQKQVEFIHVNHEESGGFAAVGQAKLTGNLGVCAGTAGPGAIHLLNALYDAKCDHVPVLAITGQVESRMMGRDYQQEVDLHALFEDVTVYNQVVTSAEHFAYVAVQAIETALARRGVAHINIPLDIAHKHVADSERWHVRVPDLTRLPVDDRGIETAAHLINSHSKVVILAGLGCLGAGDEVCALAEKLDAPIIHALKAKELFPDTHPNCIGGLGNLGVKPSMHALAQADLLLMIGTNFPYTEFLPKKIKTIQIDLNPSQLGKRAPISCGIVGDTVAVLERLTPLVQTKPNKRFFDDIQKHKNAWQDEIRDTVTRDSRPVHPAQLAYAVGQAAQDDAIFVCDTGEVTGWVARYLPMRTGQKFTVSGILATMAFAQGAAIGAKLAYPERQVIALTGDGGFSMLMTDFSTAVKYRLPMLVVVFNNARLGLIQLEQETRGLPNFQTDLHNPNFAEFAKICGGDGVRISDSQDLAAAIAQGLASPVPFVLDVVIDTEAKVIPPKVTLAQAANYALAKVKELI